MQSSRRVVHPKRQELPRHPGRKVPPKETDQASLARLLLPISRFFSHYLTLPDVLFIFVLPHFNVGSCGLCSQTLYQSNNGLVKPCFIAPNLRRLRSLPRHTPRCSFQTSSTEKTAETGSSPSPRWLGCRLDEHQLTAMDASYTCHGRCFQGNCLSSTGASQECAWGQTVH